MVAYRVADLAAKTRQGFFPQATGNGIYPKNGANKEEFQ
jgi:hypothetical protein